VCHVEVTCPLTRGQRAVDAFSRVCQLLNKHVLHAPLEVAVNDIADGFGCGHTRPLDVYLEH
jgi:hypothetical protein